MLEDRFYYDVHGCLCCLRRLLRRAPRPPHSCIDCDACRWIAPSTFGRIGGQSAVVRQPASEAERLDALAALISCPTASIRTEQPAQRDANEARRLFPRPRLSGFRFPSSLTNAAEHDYSGNGAGNAERNTELAVEGVYHLGHHSPKSFGAASWLIVRNDPSRNSNGSSSNVMVDSPRWSSALAERLSEIGGVQFIFLTPRDDVADSERWAEHFGARRIMHEARARSGRARSPPSPLPPFSAALIGPCSGPPPPAAALEHRLV